MKKDKFLIDLNTQKIHRIKREYFDYISITKNSVKDVDKIFKNNQHEYENIIILSDVFDKNKITKTYHENKLIEIYDEKNNKSYVCFLDKIDDKINMDFAYRAYLKHPCDNEQCLIGILSFIKDVYECVYIFNSTCYKTKFQITPENIPRITIFR